MPQMARQMAFCTKGGVYKPKISVALAEAGARLFCCIMKLQKPGYRLSMETPFEAPVRRDF